MDHCENNEVITEEQAAGKKGSRGCTDQLLINQMINEEVTTDRRNLASVWLDCQKAFLPHSWIVESLRLAKVPTSITHAVMQLMRKWRIRVHLNGASETIKTNSIEYQRGILQGGSLSLILFVQSVNPLSFLPKRHDGYKIGSRSGHNISHLFFVDYRKLYAQNIENAKKMLEEATVFSKDSGMTFWGSEMWMLGY